MEVRLLPPERTLRLRPGVDAVETSPVSHEDPIAYARSGGVSRDLLGGWVSGVVFAFLCDAGFLATIFAISATEARRRCGAEGLPQLSS